MFSWGEDSQRGFRVNGGSTADGVQFLQSRSSFLDLAVGRSARAFVNGNGDAFIIRSDDDSEVGGASTAKPKRVKSSDKIRAVSCCDETVTLLCEGGKLLCVDTTQTALIPRTPEALCNTKVAQVACGSQHVVALTEAGQVYTWGQDSRGQLGVGRREPYTSQPQLLQSLSLIPLVQIAAGGEQSFALSVSGGVFGWGRNDCGQLGLGNRTDQDTPTPVDCLIMKKTVYISCGKDHTVILTKDGVVFTFGSGQYGQLGHNSFRDELRPRLVAELWGAKVTKIACGWYHTLVMTDCKKVYSFGQSEHGQLGHGEESHPSVPLPVHLPQDTSSGLVIRNIFSGGHCSFAACSSMKKARKKTKNSASVDNATQQLDALIDQWVTQRDAKSLKKIKPEIHRIFSSASYLNQCFLDHRKDKHFGTSSKYSGLNLQLAQDAFEKLGNNSDVMAEIGVAVLKLLPSLDESPAGVEGLRIFFLLTELLHVIQRNRIWTPEIRDSLSIELAEKLAAAMHRLSDKNIQVIGDWWYSQNPSIMGRFIQVWKKALSLMLSFELFPYSSTVKNILGILEYMYKVNNRAVGRLRIPEKKFALAINQEVIQEELLLWRLAKNDNDDEPLILFNFTFLMDLKSKIMAFQLDAAHTQNGHQNQPWCFGWFPPPPPCFQLHLRRASLVDDAFAQLNAADPRNFKKPLSVILDANQTPSLVYQKDFFHHFFHELMSTNSRMFQFNETNTLAWFPTKTTPEDRKTFYFLGVLCGLALYNKNIIDFPFPLALFKKLLNAKPTLEDMKEFSGDGRRLQDVLNNDDDDDLENQYLFFSIVWDGTEVELDPQNPGKQVNCQNKKEFVDAYINHVFNTSVQDVFEEFKRGFFQVCDSKLVQLFQPEELRGVLVGKDVYDWTKLKQNTVYDLLCHVNHQTIRMFWEVFDELTEDQKKDFIWFLTGHRRVPILGMDQIRMSIQVKQIESGSHDRQLPESLTCHSILYLPLYSTKEIMRDRLTEALIPERLFQG